MDKQSVGYYPIDGERLPSVTSVIDYALGLPHNLMDWAVRKGTKKLLDEMVGAKKAGKKINQKDAIDIALSARKEILKQAGELGTDVHSLIQSHLEGNEFEANHPDSPDYFNSFLKWLEQNQLTPILQEKLVYDTELGFAGRLDFYGILNGKHVLIDFKTSKFFNPKYGLQLAAYKHCLEKAGHKVEASYCLYVKPDGCSLVEYTDPLEIFLKVKDIFHWKVSVDKPLWYLRKEEDELKKELNPELNTDPHKAVEHG